MRFHRLAVRVLALLLVSGGFVATRAKAVPRSPLPAAYGQDRGDWDAPPQELNDIQRQGFHAGVEAARRDFERHRHPDFRDHDEYRHPHLPREQREDFRAGFRRGYERAMHHLTGR